MSSLVGSDWGGGLETSSVCTSLDRSRGFTSSAKKDFLQLTIQDVNWSNHDKTKISLVGARKTYRVGKALLALAELDWVWVPGTPLRLAAAGEETAAAEGLGDLPRLSRLVLVNCRFRCSKDWISCLANWSWDLRESCSRRILFFSSASRFRFSSIPWSLIIVKTGKSNTYDRIP